MTIKLTKNTIYVGGRIDFDNVVQYAEKGIQFFQTMQQILIDLQELEQCDSSALALISAWIRYAKQVKKEIWFMNMPIFLQNLAKVSGVETLIPIR